MNKVDPILAVNDVPASGAWYGEIFGCTGMHGGGHFEILVDGKGEVLVCLHQWGTHEHPTMVEQVQPGNGLILYLRTDDMEAIHENASRSEEADPSEIYLNPNAGKREFTIRDPDGYFWIISEAHSYQG